MNYHEPWRTQIGQQFISGLDGTRAIGEIFSSPSMDQHGQDEQEIISDSHTPYLWGIREDVIVPAALQYSRDCWGYEIEQKTLSYHSWVAHGHNNAGIEPHIHGHSLLTSVLYLAGAPGELTLMDPRGSACRAYPTQVRRHHFANHQIMPETGMLVLFPCYIAHYVLPHPGEFRVALITDFSFR